MKNPAQVSILKKDGSVTYYSTYEDARAASKEGDTIQIWKGLNEQIRLMNNVDVWIGEGVLVNTNLPDSPVVIQYSDKDLNCRLYGKGTIKNDKGQPCIYIQNSETNFNIDGINFAFTDQLEDSNNK